MLAVDHLRVVTQTGFGSNTQPWLSQYVDGVNRDMTLATGVAFVPLAAALLVPATRLLDRAHRGVQTERIDAAGPRWHWTAVSLDLWRGGGVVGATLAF